MIMRKPQSPPLLLGSACLLLTIGLGLGSGRADTITLRSDAGTLGAALGSGVPSGSVLSRLDTSDINGLTFLPVVDGGEPDHIPPGAPPGTEDISIPPGDGENGYFMMTFTLPSNFSNIQLSGSANADDLGRVFLNGTAITPSIFSGDPGTVTEYGNATFSAQNPALFHPGTNVILISDANTGGGPSSGAFFVTITFVTGPPIITSPLIAIGTVGLPFTYQFTASGATLLEIPGSIAPGLTFNGSLAAITGIPTTAGIFSVGLRATNSSGTTNATLAITVQAAPAGPVIVSSTCATGRTGRGFSFQLQTTGGSATRFAVDNTLPPGLNIDPVTGFISGVATPDGSFSLAVSATDGAATTHATLQLTFTSDPTVPIITSSPTATLTPGQFFTYIITADANGTFGYIGTDGIVHQGPSSAGLPPGLSFDGINKISGTFNPPFEHDGGPRRIPSIAGGIVTNVQLFATDPSGTGTFPLIGFIDAAGAVNISTRLAVGTGNNVLIGGFIIQGTGTTRALIRAIGPSLTQFGVPNALQDPTLELRDGAGALLGSNDNWRDSQSYPIEFTRIPPTNNLESAILAFLSPGPYTAIVRGNNNTTGNALVEVYDLGIAAFLPLGDARLANISTRGFAGTGDNAIIGGFIIRPQAPATSTRVVIRAIGPWLTQFGVPDVLANPQLELHDASTIIIARNDDWQTTQIFGIITSDQVAETTTSSRHTNGGRPSSPLLRSYTAIVRGFPSALRAMPHYWKFMRCRRKTLARRSDASDC